MDFYQKVGLACRMIPCGKVATYGQIALLCGKPRNSRQVGYALNKGKAGKNIPAHRVVNHRGILSGASAFEMPDLQRILLEEEGIEVCITADGARVDLKKYGWHNSIEDAELLRSWFSGEGV